MVAAGTLFQTFCIMHDNAMHLLSTLLKVNTDKGIVCGSIEPDTQVTSLTRWDAVVADDVRRELGQCLDVDPSVGSINVFPLSLFLQNSFTSSTSLRLTYTMSDRKCIHQKLLWSPSPCVAD